MTKDEMIAKLTPAIGDTAYGKALIEVLADTFDDSEVRIRRQKKRQYIMTKDEMIAKLTPAIGDTAYGKALIEVLADTFDDADKKYGQDALDRIDDRLGFLKGWEKKHAAMGEDMPRLLLKQTR